MDTFFEQLVPIRKNAKTATCFLGIWFLALLLIFVCMTFFWYYINTYALILVAGVLFGAYKLSMLLFIEYEYIITNGTMDIDKITAKSSRKRIYTFELSQVERLERYNPNQKYGSFDKTIIACTPDANSYMMVVAKQGKGSAFVVFSPDERMKGAMVKFLPKFIANGAFKD